MEPPINDHYTQPPAHLRTSAVAQICAGLILIGAFWYMAWAQTGPLRHHTFFPLWLGYILLVDAISLITAGSSLSRRMGRRFLLLFVVSIPFWWLFEAANARLGNWTYVLPHEYSFFRYRLEASLAFSTVVPAVFVTAELVRYALIRRQVMWISLRPDRRGLLWIAGSGVVAFFMVMTLPDLFFPLVWISLFFVFDPISNLLGGRSISGQVADGRWDTVLVVFIATLICGFFWEMWNIRAMPKWEYDIAYAEWLHVFEMPILGYGGYLPFGLELYAAVSLLDRVLKLGLFDSIRFDRPTGSE